MYTLIVLVIYVSYCYSNYLHSLSISPLNVSSPFAVYL